MIRSILVLASTIVSAFTFATGPVSWKFSAMPSADGNIIVSLQAICEEGWHIYALTLPRDDGPLPTQVRVSANDAYSANALVQEQVPEEMDDPNFQMKVRYHAGSSVFTVPIKRISEGAFEVSGEVEFMSCNDKTCLPPQVVKFNVPIAALK